MNKYSFQIIPPHSGKVRQLRVDNRRLKWILAGVAAFVVINIAVLGLNIFLSFNTGNHFGMANVNSELSKRLDYTSVLTDSLERLLAQQSELSRQVRDIADLPPIPEDMFAYGIGGPQLPFDPDEPLIIAKAREIDQKLDSLILAAGIENKALIEVHDKFESNKKRFAHTPSIWPMRGYVSSGFGPRLDPFTGIWKMHEGIDICARKGTPVLATADGRVKFAGWHHGYGKTVKVDHIYYQTRYGHLNEINVKPGQRIKRGDIIGTCGNSGYSTGVHLHHEVRVSGKPVDPKQYLYPDVVVD